VIDQQSEKQSVNAIQLGWCLQQFTRNIPTREKQNLTTPSDNNPGFSSIKELLEGGVLPKNN
jgi:hypothetical protein